ncbi:ABC-transporter, N-terminal domain [Dillenia turbinata]|uniref:ABC-transporter, N-terminal domain n=1 Tax=Dillenia turbinata TaxID=194707 RepID=A0AAN8UKF7_9MAGN
MSFRLSSSSVYGENENEIFSRSSIEEDDEEALKWASLERLPTFSRLRKGLLAIPEGPANEIDVKNMALHEKQILLSRLVNVAEEDNEKFLLKFRDRLDRVGITLPTIEVRYQNLNVDAEAYAGSRALPTFSNFMINMVEGFLNGLHLLPNRKTQFTILRNVSGIIKPSRY